MGLTEFTLVVFLTIIGIILAMWVAAIGARDPDRFGIIGVAVSFIGIPLILFLLYSQLLAFVTVRDWPVWGTWFAYESLTRPGSVMLFACWFGAALGLYAGRSWQIEGNRSCLHCLMIPLGLIALVSVALLFLP